MKLRNVFCSVMAAAMAFVACDQEADLGAPDITLSTNEIVLPSEAGDTTITVKATLDWTVNVDETVEWLAIDPMGGNASNDDQTVTLSYFANDGYDREVSVAFTIGLKTKYLTVTQKGAQGSADALIIYANDMDNGKVEKTADGYWPYPDQTDVWKNEKGSGIENVKYGSSGVTVRSVSSTTNMWFPAKGGSYFSIQDIALNSTSSLKLTFDAIHGSNNGYKKAFSTSAFKVFVSKDAQKWVELPYELEEKAEDQFDAGSAAFTVDGVENLSVTFQFLGAEDGYRLTNISLSAYEGEGATAVDFAAATEMNFTATSSGGNNNGGNNNGGSDNGGNNGGGEVTPPADAFFVESFADGIGKFTIEDKTRPSELEYVWKHEDYNGNKYMRASAYKEAAFASESWLISPEVDLTNATAAYLSFDHTGKFFSDASKETTVWASKDGAEWTQLTIPNYTTDWVWVFSGNIDLKDFVGGKMKFAFKYLSSASNAPTWEVKNICISPSELSDNSNNGGSSDGGNTGDNTGGNTGGEVVEGDNTSSELGWTVVENDSDKSYIEKANVNGQEKTVIKLGTSKLIGRATFAIPEGSTKLTFYAVSWKAKQSTLNLSTGDVFTPAANEGVHDNSPYTFTVTDSDKYSVNLPAGTTSVTFETSGSNKRVIIFDAVAE